MDKIKPGSRFLSYRIEKCIGKGAFGSVWAAQQEGTGQVVAIKFENPSISKSILLEEAEISKDVSSCNLFPAYYGSGNEQGLNYLIIEMLGMSVRGFQENHTAEILSLGKVGEIGIGMVKAIKEFHDMGYVHRDIKPSNFVFRGTPDKNEICLIDFGLAKRWKSKDGEVFKPRENVGFRGTSRYASINSHDGYDLGRRDDLWSLFYVIIELCAPPLPWRSQSDKDAVAQIKKRGVARLCTGLPTQFEEIANHISSLGFADEPDYDLIIQKLNDVVENAEDNSDCGVCLSEQYGSMALIVAPNTGSVFGSSSEVEGSWDGKNNNNSSIQPDNDDNKTKKDDENEGNGGCCLLY